MPFKGDLLHELTEAEENMQVESDGISDRRVVLYLFLVIPFPRGVMMWDT